jgi:hypothetical protein
MFVHHAIVLVNVSAKERRNINILEENSCFPDCAIKKLGFFLLSGVNLNISRMVSTVVAVVQGASRGLGLQVSRTGII